MNIFENVKFLASNGPLVESERLSTAQVRVGLICEIHQSTRTPKCPETREKIMSFLISSLFKVSNSHFVPQVSLFKFIPLLLLDPHHTTLNLQKSMSNISSFTFMNSNSNILLPPLSASPSTSSEFQSSNPSIFPKSPPWPHNIAIHLRKTLTPVYCKAPEAEELSSPEDEWLQKLPDKKKPLYSHSLPCIEAWLRNLGFCQSNDDRAVWFIQKPDWHAQLSLDVTDLYIRWVYSTQLLNCLVPIHAVNCKL